MLYWNIETGELISRYTISTPILSFIINDGVAYISTAYDDARVLRRKRMRVVSRPRSKLIRYHMTNNNIKFTTLLDLGEEAITNISSSTVVKCILIAGKSLYIVRDDKTVMQLEHGYNLTALATHDDDVAVGDTRGKIYRFNITKAMSLQYNAVQLNSQQEPEDRIVIMTSQTHALHELALPLEEFTWHASSVTALQYSGDGTCRHCDVNNRYISTQWWS